MSDGKSGATGFDTEWTTFPVCPYCGTDNQDWWDGLAPGKGDGDTWTTGCGNCGKDFTVTMHVDTCFTTEKPEADA